MARGGSGERALERALARAQHHELRRQRGQPRPRRGDQVDALLVREAADDAEQRRRRVASQVQAPLQRRLVGRFFVER